MRSRGRADLGAESVYRGRVQARRRINPRESYCDGAAGHERRVSRRRENAAGKSAATTAVRQDGVFTAIGSWEEGSIALVDGFGGFGSLRLDERLDGFDILNGGRGISINCKLVNGNLKSLIFIFLLFKSTVQSLRRFVKENITSN